jgi:hypothetical protein
MERTRRDGLYGSPTRLNAKERLPSFAIGPVRIFLRERHAGAQIRLGCIAMIAAVVFVMGELRPGDDLCHVTNTK